MDSQFQEHLSRLPVYLSRLLESPFLTSSDLASVPKRGIYVFYEDGTPIYVGRSNTMRIRLQSHGRASSGHESATFAFLLAKSHPECPPLGKLSRANLQAHPEFAPLYARCKQRIAAMRIRVVEIEDQVDQTLFEVYAALALQTPYNHWHTH